MRVVDTPPAITDAIRAVVALADLVLIPVKPSPHDLAGGRANRGARPRRRQAVRLCRDPGEAATRF